MKTTIAWIFGAAAVALVAGCSDDSGDDSGAVSCNVVVAGANYYCMTSPDATAGDCSSATAGGTATVVDSCPSGALKTCPVTQNGKTGTGYIYSQAFLDTLTTLATASGSSDPCSVFTAG